MRKLLFSIDNFANSKRARSPPDSIETDFLTSSPEKKKAPKRFLISTSGVVEKASHNSSKTVFVFVKLL